MHGDGGSFWETRLAKNKFTAFPRNPSHIALRLFVPTTRQAGDAMRTQTVATGTAQATKCARRSEANIATPKRVDWVMAVRMAVLDKFCCDCDKEVSGLRVASKQLQAWKCLCRCSNHARLVVKV